MPTKPGPITVLLVRCGRTEWDDQDRLQGRTDLPLSLSGEEALVALLPHIAGAVPPAGVGTVYASPDEASTQTAAALAGQLGCRPRTVADLRAVDLGVWDGLLDAQLMERFPTSYRQWKDDPAAVNPPEGETFADAEARLLDTAAKLIEKANGKAIAIVLRPLAYGVVACWLGGKRSRELWSIVDDGPAFLRLSVAREFVRASLEGLKARS